MLDLKSIEWTGMVLKSPPISMEEYHMYNLKINRTRRLRKKLKIAEFQEMGFEYKTELVKAMDDETQSKLIEDLVTEVIEPRALALGGWVHSGFVSKNGLGSVTEEDRAAVNQWLANRAELKNIEVSALMDAWYF
jgi:uncharacterized protein YggL (DUF469 family)